MNIKVFIVKACQNVYVMITWKKNLHTYTTHATVSIYSILETVFISLFISFRRKDRPTSPSDLQNGSEYTHTSLHQTYSDNYQYSPKSPTQNGSSSPTVYYGNSRRSSVHSNSEPPQEVSPAHVKFVRDTSRFWYKPNISRDEGIH